MITPQQIVDIAIPRAEELVVHHDAHPLAIDKLLVRAFGHTYYVWEPETLWREIELTFGYQPSDLCRAKIQAVRTLQNNRGFWVEWEIFAFNALPLNNVLPAPGWMVKPSAAQCYVAVDIANHIGRFPFSREVAKFIAAVNLDEGIIEAVEPLKFIQRDLEQWRYRCRQCGNEDVYEGNRLCDNCMSTDLEKFPTVKLSQEEKLELDRLLTSDELPELDQDNRVHVLAAKLKMVLGYLRFRRRQMDEQFKLVDQWRR